MSARPTEAEIVREARRVLPHLVRPRSYLGSLSADYGLFTARNRWSRPLLKVAAAMVEAFARRELIILAPVGPPPACPDERRYVLSEIGAAHVRRLAAGGDFSAQHGAFERVELEGETRLRNRAESPLAWLRARKGMSGEAFLTAEEFEAGERLRRDFTFGGMQPRVTSHWSQERIDVPVRTDYSEAQGSDAALAARRRFRRAVAAVGPELAPLLVRTVCLLEGLEVIERDLGIPARAGKTVLKLGLRALARHYGLIGEERSPARGSPPHPPRDV